MIRRKQKPKTPEQQILEQKIGKLILGGKSQREIAKKLGISEAIVRRVRDEILHRETGKPDFDAPMRVCPTCHHKVYMPCLYCKIKKLQGVLPRVCNPNDDDVVESETVILEGDELVRYNAIKRT